MNKHLKYISLCGRKVYSIQVSLFEWNYWSDTAIWWCSDLLASTCSWASLRSEEYTHAHEHTHMHRAVTQQLGKKMVALSQTHMRPNTVSSLHKSPSQNSTLAHSCYGWPPGSAHSCRWHSWSLWTLRSHMTISHMITTTPQNSLDLFRLVHLLVCLSVFLWLNEDRRV